MPHLPKISKTNASSSLVSAAIFILFFGNALQKEAYALDPDCTADKFAVEFTGMISGTDTFCQEVLLPLKLTITEGTAPFTATLRRSESAQDKDTTISGITSTPWTIQVALPGTYVLLGIADANGDSAAISGNPVVLSKLPVPHVEIHGLESVYNNTADFMVSISGTPAGGRFSGPGLFVADTNWYFLPKYAPVGIQKIVYAWRENPGSCYGYDTAEVNILENEAVLLFPDGRLDYCHNEVPFVISAVNSVNDTGSFIISGGTGLTDNHDNTAIIDPSLVVSETDTITYIYRNVIDTASVKTVIHVTLNPGISVSRNGDLLFVNAENCTYQWIDVSSDFQPVEGETNGTFRPAMAGDYAVIISKNGCADTSASYTFEIADINKNVLAQRVTVVPNPSNGLFTIKLDQLYPYLELTVTDVNGKLVEKHQYKDIHFIDLFLSSPAGVYLLKISSGKEEGVFRVVKK